MVCRLYSAWALWFLGFPDRALERVEAGLALAQRLAHANSLAFAMSLAAVLHTFRRDFDAARRRAEAAIEIATEHRMPQWLAQRGGGGRVWGGRLERGVVGEGGGDEARAGEGAGGGGSGSG